MREKAQIEEKEREERLKKEKEERQRLYVASLPHSQRIREESKLDFRKLVDEIAARDGWKCANCGQKSKLQLDHVIPVSLGGTNDPNNLQLLCVHCNTAKGNKTMGQWDGRKRRLSEPELEAQRWIGKSRDERIKEKLRRRRGKDWNS